MPDPIRVTKAVRRCPSWEYADRTNAVHSDDLCDCTDGWVDVPVDEECPKCHTLHGGVCCPGRQYLGETWTSSGDALTTPTNVWAGPCPDCAGSGRRLHDWATGWCVGDEVLVDDQFSDGRPARIASRDIDGIWEVLDDGSHASYGSDPSRWTLVLSDPSHRPEPMRWKQ